MKDGIKGGQVRVFYPHQEPIIALFCQCKVNPFLRLSQHFMNQFLTKHLKVTMRSGRHCGAYLILNEQNDLRAVAAGLGHATLMSTVYYIDPWLPNVSHEKVTRKLTKLLKFRFGE